MSRVWALTLKGPHPPYTTALATSAIDTTPMPLTLGVSRAQKEAILVGLQAHTLQSKVRRAAEEMLIRLDGAEHYTKYNQAHKLGNNSRSDTDHGMYWSVRFAYDWRLIGLREDCMTDDEKAYMGHLVVGGLLPLQVFIHGDYDAVLAKGYTRREPVGPVVPLPQDIGETYKPTDVWERQKVERDPNLMTLTVACGLYVGVNQEAARWRINKLITSGTLTEGPGYALGGSRVGKTVVKDGKMRDFMIELGLFPDPKAGDGIQEEPVLSVGEEVTETGNLLPEGVTTTDEAPAPADVIDMTPVEPLDAEGIKTAHSVIRQYEEMQLSTRNVREYDDLDAKIKAIRARLGTDYSGYTDAAYQASLQPAPPVSEMPDVPTLVETMADMFARSEALDSMDTMAEPPVAGDKAAIENYVQLALDEVNTAGADPRAILSARMAQANEYDLNMADKMRELRVVEDQIIEMMILQEKADAIKKEIADIEGESARIRKDAFEAFINA